MTPLEQLGRYADTPVELRVVIDRLSLSIRDLIALRPGQTLPTRRLLREDLDLDLGKTRLASVELTPAGDAIAARVSTLHTGAES